MKIKEILYINTVNHKSVEIALLDHNKQKTDSIKFSCKYQFQIKDKLLVSINKIQNKHISNNLRGIIVKNKSSEMTSLRIGIATANALAYSLNIPIMGIEKFDSTSLSITNLLKSKKSVVPIYTINPMLKP